VCSSVLQCVAVCCSMLQCVAVCSSVLQCVAVYCSVLQCVAVGCRVLQCVAVCCSVLQCVAVCCSVLQCVAVCCSRVERHSCMRISTKKCLPPNDLQSGNLQIQSGPKFEVQYASRDIRKCEFFSPFGGIPGGVAFSVETSSYGKTKYTREL